MKATRASYKAGIAWVTNNDVSRDPSKLMTVALLASLFGVTVEKVTKDVGKARDKMDKAEKDNPQSTYNLTLTKVHPGHFINTIRIARDLREDFGLKEAKEFVERVRAGRPETLLRGITKSAAEHCSIQFETVDAQVRIDQADTEAI